MVNLTLARERFLGGYAKDWIISDMHAWTCCEIRYTTAAPDKETYSVAALHRQSLHTVT
jgi:hypothetical protein